MTLHQLPCCTILLHCLPANWYGNCCAKIGICHGVFFKDGTTRNPPAPRSFNSLLWKKLRVTAGAAYKTRYTYSTLKVWLIMGEPLLENSILDQFINSHEQSYEEFLNTFTYLLKEKEGKTIQGSKGDSLRKKSFTSELPDRNKQDGSPERNKEMWGSFPPRMANENETVMSESSTAGVSDGNNLSLSERVKVDKYLHLEDVDTDEETCSAGSLVLPGEVEETVSCCTPFFDKPIQPKFRAWSVPQPSDSKAQEAECLFEDTSTRSNAEMQYSMSTKHILANALLGDDVQPFSLDEEFDYDNVALTPKFSEAELKSIIELSEEKMGTDVKSARAED
ncbi:intraflagellar transport-associated protein isoform X3 [Passer montanus]|uniref:intraflagellar transport-associated protein isoform X3 n=1 Tax=Passer montanus TaxID=9160 RepID=UPI00196087F6|nr:intraflagellar transport-associated protein isoform X3 [Passer montanus]